jgi:hypothetical protein
MNRRKFLQRTANDVLKIGLTLSLESALFSSFSCNRPSGDEYFLVCDGRNFNYPGNASDPRPVPATRGYVRALNLRTNEISEMRFPFRGHFIDTHPLTPNQAVTSIKWGAHAAVFDFMSKQILHVIEARPNTRFMGHGVYSRDGRHLIMSQTDDLTHQGFLSIIDSKTYRTVSEFPSYGAYPHECARHPTEDAVYVMNGIGDKGSLFSLVSLRDGKLLNQVSMGNQDGNFYHFHVGQDRYVVAGGFTQIGETDERLASLMAVIDPDGNVSRLRWPESENPIFAAEALSIAMNEKRGLAAFALPQSDRVHIWNYKDKSHVRSLHFNHPMGISLSPEKNIFVVSELLQRGPVRYLDDALEAVGDLGPQSVFRFGNGSHLTRVVV